MTDKPRTATEIELAKEKAYENMVKWAKWLVENKKDDEDCPSEHWLFGGKDGKNQQKKI